MEGIVEELIRIKEQGASAVLATVVDAGENGVVRAGDKCLVRDGQIKGGTIHNQELLKAILAEAENRLREERSKLVSLEMPATALKAEVFFEVLPAPPRLYIVGAGHIAVPLAKIAKILEYRVTVLDDRVLFANRERFPDADEIQVGDMAETLKKLPIDSSTYIVLITRGHKYDEPCLREIIHSRARYIGMIGSKR
ncbi:MAG: XdhC family protein, partial [Candidatus Binatia bacterium]